MPPPAHRAVVAPQGKNKRCTACRVLDPIQDCYARCSGRSFFSSCLCAPYPHAEVVTLSVTSSVLPGTPLFAVPHPCIRKHCCPGRQPTAQRNVAASSVSVCCVRDRPPSTQTSRHRGTIWVVIAAGRAPPFGGGSLKPTTIGLYPCQLFRSTEKLRGSIHTLLCPPPKPANQKNTRSAPILICLVALRSQQVVNCYPAVPVVLGSCAPLSHITRRSLHS